MKLSVLRVANVRRCEEVFHKLDHWSPTDWACALAGEAGEGCNAVKKLRRLADGTNTAKDPQTEDEAIKQIGFELADTIIYADLLAARLGIDLSEYIEVKFNEVSARMKSKVRLGSRSDVPGICSLCDKPMPEGEEMFKYHGYSGPCPTE
jgi:NTP pyrophosphatase (non-canonical NTP hydrolase)